MPDRLTSKPSLSLAIFAPGVPQLMEEFRITNSELGSFVVSIYILGVGFSSWFPFSPPDACHASSVGAHFANFHAFLPQFALGPLVIAPLSEIYGRSIVYHVCNLGFLAFVIACAVAPSMNSLIAFRFISGIFGSCPISNGGGTIADMIVQEKRGFAMSIYTLGPLIGPVVGPVAGGFLSGAKGWRWCFWVLAIATGFMSICMMVFMKETYAHVILDRKTAKLRKETGNEQLRSKLDAGLSTTDYFKRSIVRPLKLMAFSPITQIFAVS